MALINPTKCRMISFTVRLCYKLRGEPLILVILSVLHIHDPEHVTVNVKASPNSGFLAFNRLSFNFLPGCVQDHCFFNSFKMSTSCELIKVCCAFMDFCSITMSCNDFTS